ncbi:MAG: hypothetical protein Q8L41_16505 [Anaerolineales bacterium]|nr:hypothetical protein [Anaerolineales bacterium]MDP2777142.1 hypothetical protein [Anaerolineales bacterium]
MFRQSKYAAVLMGAAGLFTPSGNPDYCSTGTGLWSQDEPLKAVFAWLRPLAELEKTG